MSRTTPVERYRNVGIVAHVDAGKTTTTERILLCTAVSEFPGGAEAVPAVTGGMERGEERGISITAAATTCFWKGHRINIVDSPGRGASAVEAERGLRVMDGAVWLLCGVRGVEPQAEVLWRQADRCRVPRLAFVNKMDRVGADFGQVVSQIRERLGSCPLPVQLPLGENGRFEGVIDLVAGRARVWDEEGAGGPRGEDAEIPANQRAGAARARAGLLESLGDLDEGFRRLCGAGVLPSEAAVRLALRRVTLALRGVPVLCGAAFRNRGVQLLLDAVVDYLPSPAGLPAREGSDGRGRDRAQRRGADEEPFSALAFKAMTDPYVGPVTFLRVYSGTCRQGAELYNTKSRKRERIGRLLEMHASDRREIETACAGDIVAALGLKNTVPGDTLCDPGAPVVLEPADLPPPVACVVLEPRTRADGERLGVALAKLSAEDPSLVVRLEEETGQAVVSGTGERHLEVAVDRLAREFGIDVVAGKPVAALRETVSGPARGEGGFVRSGGEQCGHVALFIEPRELSEPFLFEVQAPGGAVPEECVPAVRRGIEEAMGRGIVAGYPVTGVKAILVGGSAPPEGASEVAFRLAASQAFKKAVLAAGPRLLEPLMDLEVVTPEEFVGEVLADLKERRSEIRGIERQAADRLLRASVPLARMFGYAEALGARTQGRGTFRMRFSRYETVPETAAPAPVAQAR